MQLKDGTIVFLLVFGGCQAEDGGKNMATRTQLNMGLDNLSGVAGTLSNAHKGLVDAINLSEGGLVALDRVSGAKGASVNIPIAYFKGKGSITSLQFDVLLPTGITFQSVTIGPAGTAAQKSVSANAVANGVRVLIFGVNQTVIGDGLLATFRVAIGASVPSGSTSLGVTGVTASNGAGVGVQVTASTGTITVN